MLKKNAIESIECTIGYEFTDKQLISQAFTRSSYHYEHPEDQDNELLEFIGDSVLSLIVVNILIDKYSGRDGSGLYACRDEGDFSMLKSSLVNKQFLAKQMSKLNLQDYLKMSIGDEGQGIRNGKSVLEDLFESIVGAVYLDTNGNLKNLCKMIREWKDEHNVDISGYAIDTIVYNFIKNYQYKDKSFIYYDWLTRDFFKYLSEQPEDSYLFAPGSYNYLKIGSKFNYKASNAYKKAQEAISDEEKYPTSAKREWREIYGNKFPS